jgi:hypothetical protein
MALVCPHSQALYLTLVRVCQVFCTSSRTTAYGLGKMNDGIVNGILGHVGRLEKCIMIYSMYELM